MKKAYPFFFIFGLALIQATVLDNFKFFYVKPDLLLIGAVASCFYFDFNSAILLSLSAGILKDIFVASQLGFNTILFPFFSFLILNLTKKMVIEIYYLFAAIIFLIAFLYHAFLKLMFSFSGDYISWSIFLRIAFLSSLYSAVISPVLFSATKKISLYSNK